MSTEKQFTLVLISVDKCQQLDTINLLISKHSGSFLREIIIAFWVKKKKKKVLLYRNSLHSIGH